MIPVLLAKRFILSPPSLEQRVDFFRRQGYDRDGLLEQVKPLVHKSNGDSRADALVDLLAAVWARTPEERVLVAAQNNLTVDYLFALVQARLPEIGPIGARYRSLQPVYARAGKQTRSKTSAGSATRQPRTWRRSSVAMPKSCSRLRPRRWGSTFSARVVLVLYSVPWRPEEVEQWIGRLDRIGNVAAFSNEGAKTIDVYTIAQRGLVDEKVRRGTPAVPCVRASVNLDGDHLGEVAQAIEDAALRPDSVSWRALEDRTASMADEDAVQELNSALRPHLPWQVRWATAVRERLDDLPPIAPVLTKLPPYASAGPKAWDRAIEPLFKLLDKAGDYYVRKNTSRDRSSLPHCLVPVRRIR